ncbi:MAG TPA: hypothetical protein VGM27_33370 [Acidobacteriaceae bacterium]|jgi:hypothetical protein
MNPPIEISATLPEGQSSVLPVLHGVLCDCGGWILNRGFIGPGIARFVFEFPRDICVEIYSALVSLGFELTPASHRTLTELCRCTPYLFDLPSRTITAVDQTSLDESTRYVCSLEIVKAELCIQFIPPASTGAGVGD